MGSCPSLSRLTLDNYFFCIGFPQQESGTLHALSSPGLHVQALATLSSRPHTSHTNRSPSFMSQQFAIFKPSFPRLFSRKAYSEIYFFIPLSHPFFQRTFRGGIQGSRLSLRSTTLCPILACESPSRPCGALYKRIIAVKFFLGILGPVIFSYLLGIDISV